MTKKLPPRFGQKYLVVDFTRIILKRKYFKANKYMGSEKTNIHHRFLDEAGDTTFYGKGKVPIIGENGVSNYFILGMLTVNEPLFNVRNQVLEIQNEISNDPYYNEIPSVQKRKNKKGYFLHAKDDVPEIRKMFFDYIKRMNCSFDAVVGKKNYGLYERKHNGKEAEFYGDLLAHLLKGNLSQHPQLVLNIAHRSRCTTHKNLELGLSKAINIAKKYRPDETVCKVSFNIQTPLTEPLLNIADYFLWAIQRKFEREESRYYNFLEAKIGSILDLHTNEEP